MLNRPHEMNALSREMKLELVDCFSMLETDDSVRAVILTGGDYVFSAGMDLKEMAPSRRRGRRLLQPDRQLPAEDFCLPQARHRAVGGIDPGRRIQPGYGLRHDHCIRERHFSAPVAQVRLNPLFNPVSRSSVRPRPRNCHAGRAPSGAMEALPDRSCQQGGPSRSLHGGGEDHGEGACRPASKGNRGVKRISEVAPYLDKSSALEYEFEISALLFSRTERKEYMRQFLDELKQKKKEVKKSV